MRVPSTRHLSAGVVVVALALATAVLLGSCAGSEPSASASIAASVAPTATNTVGTSGLERPGLPAGFPLMPGMVAVEPPPSESGLIGRWTTNANGADVFRFLERALPAAGYRVDLLGPGDTVAVIRFTPPGGEQLQIDLGQEAEGTFMELRVPRD